MKHKMMTQNKAVNKLTYEIAHKYFLYEEESGKLYWRYRSPEDLFVISQMTPKGIKSFNIKCSGNEVGTVYTNKSGNEYLTFSLKLHGSPNNYSVHRVIWLMMTGAWPQELDHIDGNGLNNSYINMREVDRSLNNKNHRLASNNNVTKVTGVRFYSNLKTPLWQAYGYDGTNRKQIQLGNFDNFFDAICARKSYETKNGFTERHGR